MMQMRSSIGILDNIGIYACKPLVRVGQELLCGQRRDPTSNVLSVYYHCVTDARLNHLKYLYEYKNVAQFNHDLEVFAKAFEPITIEEFMKLSETGWRHRKQPILITFDDGLREIHDIVAPLLLRKGIPATVFVTRDFVDNRFLCYHHRASLLLNKLDELASDSRLSVEKDVRILMKASACPEPDVRTSILGAAYDNRPLIDEIARALDVDFDSFLESAQPYLTSQQLRKLAEWGFGLGGHGIDHSHYPHLSLAEQLRQTEESVLYLKEALNLKYGVFSFPHGENGVPGRFFECLRSRGVVDLCFGTRGFVRDDERNLHQRLGMEKTQLGAGRVIFLHLARAFAKALIGRSSVRRN